MNSVNESPNSAWFANVDEIILDPLRFKLKLAIGEDAYNSIRIKKNLWTVWDTASAAGTGVWAAKLPVIASLVAVKSPLAYLGLATASTPLGWVILAGALSGGAWFGITRYLKNLDQERVEVIPKFINTPLDVLALGLFDLMAPLSLKMANMDGKIDPAESDAIKSYFIEGWGYNPIFVGDGLNFIISNLENYNTSDLARTLAEFQKDNPDCNFEAMSKELMIFLQKVTEADGVLDEREEMAMNNIAAIFGEAGKINFSERAKNVYHKTSEKVSDLSGEVYKTAGGIVDKAGEITNSGCNSVKETASNTLTLASDLLKSLKLVNRS